VKQMRRYWTRTYRIRRNTVRGWRLDLGYWVPGKRDRFNVIRTVTTGSKTHCERAAVLATK
jgi:hypothetical protein